jgi:hypothetical protein
MTPAKNPPRNMPIRIPAKGKIKPRGTPRSRVTMKPAKAPSNMLPINSPFLRSKQVIKIKLFRNKPRGIIDLGFAREKKKTYLLAV